MITNPQGYTMVPNELFDSWLPFLSEKELKVILSIIKIGESDVDVISIKANLTLREVTDALKALINREILEVGEVK